MIVKQCLHFLYKFTCEQYLRFLCIRLHVSFCFIFFFIFLIVGSNLLRFFDWCPQRNCVASFGNQKAGSVKPVLDGLLKANILFEMDTSLIQRTPMSGPLLSGRFSLHHNKVISLYCIAHP